MSLVPPKHIQDLIEAEVLNSPKQLARVVDYLLVTGDTGDTRTVAGDAGPFDLAADVQIVRLDDVLAERLLRATELRGENSNRRSRSRVVHAYVREVWKREDGDGPEKLYSWDPDGRLYSCLVLSRLVRDNGASCEHAARRLVTAGGDERLLPFDAFDSHVAYRLHPDRPGWLDAGEAHRLRDLFAAYQARGFPARVAAALRRTESVARERFLEDALPLAVGAAEALLKVEPAYARKHAGRDYAREQFVQRVPQLAADVGTRIARPQCDEIYRDRSALVHGDHVDLSKPRAFSQFEAAFVALVETLRAALHRALIDPAFAANFANDPAITAQWPTTVKQGGQPVTF
jgi:hypothetical protein